MDSILIVDDNEDFLGLAKVALDKHFNVDTARTAEEALHMVKEKIYKAMVLDVSLPDFTGYYLGRKIREYLPSANLAFLTNYDGEVTRENAEEVKATLWKKTDFVKSPKTFYRNIHKLYE